MAGTSSSFVWVVIGLLLVPLVALGADTIQRGLESESFPTAPLHAHERFVYDVTVLSDFTATATTGGDLIEIVVGDYDDDAPEGVFPIRVTRGPAPWETNVQPLWEDEKHRVAARLDVVVREFVDTNEGHVLVSKEDTSEQQWYSHEGDSYRYTLDTESQGHTGREQGIAAAVARVADATWIHDVQELPVIGRPAAAEPGPHDLPLSGVYAERQVYGRNVSILEEYATGGAPFGCSLEAPTFDYTEPDTTARHAGIPVQVATTRVEWRAPKLALPVVVECHRAYVSTSDGSDMGHIRVIATLSDHDAGGAAHRVAWDDEPTPLPSGPHTTVPTIAPGVPADTASGAAPNEPLGNGETGLRFPLDSAHDVARDWLYVQAPDFASSGTVPYALVAATYWPGTTMTPACAGLPDDVTGRCDELPLPLQRPQQAFVEPHWYLTYENQEAERVIVQALRNMTATGQVIEDFAKMVGERHTSPFGPLVSRVPDKLVPVHDLLDVWLDEQEISLERWREQEAARFEYRLEPTATSTDQELQPTYAFREGHTIPATQTSTHPLAPAESGNSEHLHQTTRTCTYLASDGALIDKRETDFRIDDHAFVPAAPGPASFAMPEETTHRPVAAVIVGVIGLSAVALGATPGGRTWLRGLLALPLFTKLNKDDVLEHRTRDAMLSYVKANPGVGTEEIRRHLDVGWGTAVYHLSALEQNRLLASMRRGGNRHWFAAGLGRAHDREAIALLRSAAARRLHEAIRNAPGRTQQELASELGVTHGAVIFQVRKLERVGLIRKERDGRFVRYFVAAADERVADTNAT